MASKIKICNWALSRIAVSTTIDSIDEPSEEAKACALFFDQVRDEVLREFDWAFATRYVHLALIPGWESQEWRFAYRYPAEALRIVRLVQPGRRPPQVPRVKYAVSGDVVGRMILTDQEEAEAVYIARVTDPAQWPQDFASLVAWRLASEIAAPLSQSGALADRCLREYRAALYRATAATDNEQYWGDDEVADYIAARS